MEVGVLYFSNSFSTCQEFHTWHSLGLKSLTNNHSTSEDLWCHDGHVREELKRPRECPEALGIFKWTQETFANFDHWLKRMTCSLSLRWCRTKAVHKCYAFRLKRNNLLSPTPDICRPLLALSVFIGAGQPLEHGEVRDSNLASVGPVVGLTYYWLCYFIKHLVSWHICFRHFWQCTDTLN